MALGGWSPLQYLWFLLAGYLIASHEGVQRRIVQARWVALGLALLMVAASLALDASPGLYPFVVVWHGIIAVFGFAAQHLTVRNRLLAYATEAVLPFYILHQNMILWLDFFVVTWPVPDLVKYAIMALPSFGITLLAYEYAVRRVGVLRLLFGMKPLRGPRVSGAGISMTQPAGLVRS